MPRKYRKQVIRPFPENIDRRDFGNWVSGFTDGEGCFILSWARHVAGHSAVMATFHIQLRRDDIEILRLMQSFFACGSVSGNYAPSRLQGNRNPAAVLRIRSIRDHISTTIPHFEKHPLRAKKARDFELWKQGVFVADSVNNRRMKLGGERGFRGSTPWSKEEKEKYNSFANALREQRTYDSDLIAPVPFEDDSPSLF